MCESREGEREKERTRLGCLAIILLLTKFFLSLFLGGLAENGLWGGYFCFISFFFLLVFLQSPIHNKCTSPPSHYSCPCYQILSPFEMKAKIFPLIFGSLLAGHLEVPWLP